MTNEEMILDRLNEIHKLLYSTRLIDGQNDEVFVAEKSIDGLGRLTIPKSIRRELDIDENTRLKIFRGQNEIIIKKG